MVAGLVLWGEVLIYRGDFAGGRKAFEEAITRAQADSQIYGNDPWYAQYRLLGTYLLSVTLVALNDSTEAAKRLREGDQVFGDAWRQLRTIRGPSTAASFCADVATELGYLGDGLKKKGRHQEMANVYEIAIKALAQAIELDPKNAGFWNSQASLYMQVGQPDKAIADYSKLIELQEKLAADFPTVLEHRHNLGSSRAIRAISRVNAGRVSEGIAEIADFAKSSDWNGENWYNFACVYAVAAGKSPQKKQEYGDRAMELLNKAVQAGFKDAAQMKQDTDLASLHEREDFKKLVAKLAAAKKP
jgi:tetratricopeptide (TPR) repeat protein